MAKKKVLDLIVDTLAAGGVERVYGIAGDSLNRTKSGCGL
jgi:thiamine pyrophosphate-dependent acetolactate synthase large subunit-like protein